MTEEATIYALCDPDGAVRYVGVAVNPERRFAQHLAGTKTRPRLVDKWIAGLLAAGMEPLWKELERLPVERAGNAERYWIRRLFAEGCALTNASVCRMGAAPAESIRKSRRMLEYEEETGRDVMIAIREALTLGHGVTRIAADLGISLQTLYLWMRTLGLTVERRAVVHGPEG